MQRDDHITPTETASRTALLLTTAEVRKVDQILEAYIEDTIRKHTGDNSFEIKQLMSKEPFYHAYVRSAFYITRFAHDFNVKTDSVKFLEKTAFFFFWLKSIDNLIDQCGMNPDVLFSRMERIILSEKKDANPMKYTDELICVDSFSKTVRELKKDQQIEFINELNKLKDLVKEEFFASDLAQLRESRLQTGALTASCLLHYLGDLVPKDSTRFKTAMIEIGAVGNLFDSIIDLKRDIEEGTVRFPYKRTAHLRFVLTSIKDVSKLLFKYPEITIEIPGIFAKYVRSHKANYSSSEKKEI